MEKYNIPLEKTNNQFLMHLFLVNFKVNATFDVRLQDFKSSSIIIGFFPEWCDKVLEAGSNKMDFLGRCTQNAPSFFLNGNMWNKVHILVQKSSDIQDTHMAYKISDKCSYEEDIKCITFLIPEKVTELQFDSHTETVLGNVNCVSGKRLHFFFKVVKLSCIAWMFLAIHFKFIR